jgi:hypothetical protein
MLESIKSKKEKEEDRQAGRQAGLRETEIQGNKRKSE